MTALPRRLLPMLAAGLLLTGLPVATASTSTPHSDRTVAAQSGPSMYKRYLLGNKWEGMVDDDGVKGIVKNFTPHRIIVRDTVADKKVDIWPGQAVVFYADQDLSRFGSLVEGNGTWLEISRYDTPLVTSEFRLVDPVFGRPDTYFMGPGRKIQNQRESWREGESHHEITDTHRFWVKREDDSWREKYDNWNTSDWAAFSIHVDQL